MREVASPGHKGDGPDGFENGGQETTIIYHVGHQAAQPAQQEACHDDHRCKTFQHIGQRSNMVNHQRLPQTENVQQYIMGWNFQLDALLDSCQRRGVYFA
eukprot:288805-Pelagomonas_calceolata.AAC.4